MQKQYVNYYPFSVSAEQKTSKANNQYISIGICHKTKDKDGQKKEVYFNLIDERDLLVIRSACEMMYHKIIKAKNDDFMAKKDTQQIQKQAQPQQAQQTTAQEYRDAKNGVAPDGIEDDDIPF